MDAHALPLVAVSFFTHAVAKQHGLDGYCRVRTRRNDGGYVADFINTHGAAGH